MTQRQAWNGEREVEDRTARVYRKEETREMRRKKQAWRQWEGRVEGKKRKSADRPGRRLEGVGWGSGLFFFRLSGFWDFEERWTATRFFSPFSLFHRGPAGVLTKRLGNDSQIQWQ